MMIDHCHFNKILVQNNVQNKKGKHQPVDLAFSAFHEPFFSFPTEISIRCVYSVPTMTRDCGDFSWLTCPQPAGDVVEY